jgi:hypothetical protein
MPAPPFKASSIELTSILTQTATSTPAQPVNGTAALYAADSSGVTTLFVIKDDNTSFELGAGTNATYTQEYSFPESPGNTINERMFRPFAITITSIQIYAHTVGTTAGTYLFYFGRETWPAAGTNLLNAGSLDLTALGAATLTTANLTSTTANLDIPASTVVNLQFASNNVDLAGFTGIKVFVNYEKT